MHLCLAWVPCREVIHVLWYEWRQMENSSLQMQYIVSLLHEGAGLSLEDVMQVPGGVKMSQRTEGDTMPGEDRRRWSGSDWDSYSDVEIGEYDPSDPMGNRRGGSGGRADYTDVAAAAAAAGESRLYPDGKMVRETVMRAKCKTLNPSNFWTARD